MPITSPFDLVATSSSAPLDKNLAQALIVTTGEQLATLNMANDFQQTLEIELRFLRAANGTAGKVVMIPGAGLKGTFADNNTVGTTFASPDWSDVDNWYDYTRKVGMQVNGIRFDTTDVNNYNKSITVGERMPNGTVRGRKVNLSKFREATGNTYANTAEFRDNSKFLTLWPGFVMEMSDLEKGSSFSVFLTVVGIGKTVQASPVKY